MDMSSSNTERERKEEEVRLEGNPRLYGLHIRYAISLELAMRAGTQQLTQVSSAETNLLTVCPSSRGAILPPPFSYDCALRQTKNRRAERKCEENHSLNSTQLHPL